MSGIIRTTIAAAALAVVAITVTACGSGSGATTYFQTVNISPTGSIADATTTISTTGTNTDGATVSVSLQSTISGSPLAPSPVSIQSSYIGYTKVSGTSAPTTLQNQPGPTGQIPAGGTLPLTFNPASAVVKNAIVASGFISPWQYRIRYYFSMKEDYTNKTHTMEVDGGTITFQ